MTTDATQHSRLLSLTALMLVGAVCAPAVARADGEEAKRYFERAQTAYRLGKYEQAISDYEAAYEAMPSPAFLFNIAQSQRMQYGLDKKVWRLNKALALYKSYLREADEATNRDVVRNIIDELKQLLGDVQRRSREQDEAGQIILRGTEGALAKLDGKEIGQLPIRKEVAPGTHVLRVTLEGHMPWESTVRVSAGGQLDVPVLLKPLERTAAPSASVEAETTPFYRKWWFWTLAGAAVAAGAGTGIYLATRDEGGAELVTIDLRN
jgi:tetratricopeptide (TPR) repeat protein